MLLFRYVVKEHIFPFLASLSIIVFLFIMQQVILMLDRIVSKNIDPLIVLEVFLIQLGWIIALGVPMAVLAATLMTFGRMAGDNEITAIKASGRSMSSLMLPVLVAGSVVTVALFYFHDLVLPEANHRAANLLGDISRKRPAAFIEPGVLIRDFQNYALYTEEVNPFTGDLEGIRIFSNAPGEDPMVTVAERGNIQMTNDGGYLELTLLDGETHSLSRNNDRDYLFAQFKKQVIYIKNVDTRFERTSAGDRGDREMSIAMMMAEVRELRGTNANLELEFGRLSDTINSIKSRMDTAFVPAAAEDDARRRLAIAQGKTQRHDNPLGGTQRPKAAQGSAAAPDTPATAAPPGRRDIGLRDAGQLRQYESNAARIDNNIAANDLTIAQYMVEVHKKFAIPAACLIFIMIGAPLGIMARRGGLAVGASYSVFFFIIYWVFLITGENMADKMLISPAVGMWSGNVFLVICGLILMVLMMRETSINFGFIKRFFGKGASAFRSVTGSWIFRLPGFALRVPRLLLNFINGRLPAYLMVIFLGFAFGLMAALIVIFITIDYVGNMSRFENATHLQAALFYYYYTPWIAQTVMPIVLFLSSMFAMGKIAKSSELTAMKAAGVNVRQLTMPLLFLGLLLSVGVFYGGELVIPAANEKRALLQSAFNASAANQNQGQNQSQNAAGATGGIREFRRNFYYFAEPNVVYNFNEFSTQPQFFRGVRRYTFTPGGGISERIDAAEATFDSTGWSFINGQVRTFSEDGMAAEQFASRPDDVLTPVPLDIVKRVRGRDQMSYWELSNHIEAAKRRGEKVHKFTAELEFKVAMPFMNFIVILFGLSLAARTGRRGGGATLLGIGLLLSFLFWILSRFMLVFAQNGYLPVLVGAWAGNVIFLILGLILYRRAAY